MSATPSDPDAKASIRPYKPNPMPMVFSINEKCYTSPEIIGTKMIGDQTHTGVLYQRFTHPKGSTVVLKISGKRNMDPTEHPKGEDIFNLKITVHVRDVKEWTSTPVEVESRLPRPFVVSSGHTTMKAAQKRFIYFRTKKCTVTRKSIPKLINASLESQMRAIVADVRRWQDEGVDMKYNCLVDEYRTDGKAFTTINDIIRDEKPRAEDSRIKKVRTIVKKCHRCKELGHARNECRKPYCKRCKEFGHELGACENVYAEQNIACSFDSGNSQPGGTWANQLFTQSLPSLKWLVDWYSLVESGQAFDTTFTMNGTSYSIANSTSSKETDFIEKEPPRLFLHFADSLCFSIVLRISQARRIQDIEHLPLHYVYLKFFTGDIEAFRSIPLPAQGWGEATFDIWEKHISPDQPKRKIYFEAKRCRVDHNPTSRELEILKDIAACQDKGTNLCFSCIIDEHRDDRAAFENLEQAIEGFSGLERDDKLRNDDASCAHYDSSVHHDASCPEKEY